MNRRPRCVWGLVGVLIAALASGLAASQASAGPGPERLAFVRLGLQGPLQRVELWLFDRRVASWELELESGDERELELAYLLPAPGLDRPEVRASGGGSAQIRGMPRLASALAVAPGLQLRPAPEPAFDPPRRLPLEFVLLLVAAGVVAVAVPSGPGARRTLALALCLWLLPGAISIWAWYSLARRPPAPVRTCLEVAFGEPLALLQRVGVGQLELLDAPQSLSTWPEWATAEVRGQLDGASGELHLGARAPGARLIERRAILAPFPPADREAQGLRVWKPAQGGYAGGHAGPAGAGPPGPPAWALYPAPPGSQPTLVWSGRAEDPVERWSGLP